MKFFLLLLSAISLMTTGQCGSKAATPGDHTPLVQLETRGCRGFCPTYKLHFRHDGTVEYEGIRNMVKMGFDTILLTPSELKQLKTAVKEVNLWQYPEHFDSPIADAPPSVLTVFEADKKHEVEGDASRPAPILAFEELLKTLAETHGLKVKTGVDPYTAPANQQELIVKFQPDINPGNFLMQLDKVRLRIVRRVTAENIWVIGYNPDQIAEKNLIELLKGMNGVIDAAPLKQK